MFTGQCDSSSSHATHEPPDTDDDDGGGADDDDPPNEAQHVGGDQRFLSSDEVDQFS